MANLKELLQDLVSGADEHKWNGLAPDCVALIFVRYLDGGGRSNLEQQALVCNSYPITKDDADEYLARFRAPEWQCAGHIFSYRHPHGGTQFKEHSAAEFGDEKWAQMLKAPVLGTGLSYFEKIVCRMTETSYDEYLELKRKAEVSSKEPGAELAQVSETGSMPSCEQTGDMHSAPELAGSKMRTVVPDLPRHECLKPGSPILGFAPLDFDVMKAMIDRDASKDEISAQIGEWIRADAAKNPNPTEPVEKRLQLAVMTNNPFAIYCGRCLELVCLIHPEAAREEHVVNEDEDVLKPTAEEDAITERVQDLRSELEKLGRWEIVTWCNNDIITALEHAGAVVSPENVKAVREHFFVDSIADRMTEVGFTLIEEAIYALGLVPRSTPDKKGA